MLKRKKAIFLSVFLIILTSFLYSLDSEIITPDCAVAISDQNNLTVKGVMYSLCSGILQEVTEKT